MSDPGRDLVRGGRILQLAERAGGSCVGSTLLRSQRLRAIGRRPETGSQLAGRTGYRLPTEGEWEYACRAGAGTRYNYGQARELLGSYAWYFENSNERSWPVGQLRPNGLGLYDMHGNVFEWCQDWYESYGRAGMQADDGATRVGGPGPGVPGRELGLRGRDLPVGEPPQELAGGPVPSLGFRVARSPSGK